MVVMAADERHSRGLWCIDDAAALVALAKGTSDSASLDQMVKMIQLARFAPGALYTEDTELKTNWSGVISRRSIRGARARRNGSQWKPMRRR